MFPFNTKVICLATSYFVASCSSFASSHYFLCYFTERGKEKEYWRWATFENEYVPANGQVTDDGTFKEIGLDESFIREICRSTVENLARDNGEDYQLTRMQVGTTWYSRGYDINFSAPDSKYELINLPAVFDKVFSPGNAVAEDLENFLSYEDDSYEELVKDLRDSLVEYDNALTRTAELSLKYVQTFNNYPEAIAFGSHFVNYNFERLDFLNYCGKRLERDSVIDSTLLAGISAGIKESSVIEKFLSTSLLESTSERSSLFAAIRSTIVYLVIRDGIYRQQSVRVKEFLKKKFDKDKHVPRLIIRNQEAALTEILYFYLTVTGQGIDKVFRKPLVRKTLVKARKNNFPTARPTQPTITNDEDRPVIKPYLVDYQRAFSPSPESIAVVDNFPLPESAQKQKRSRRYYKKNVTPGRAHASSGKEKDKATHAHFVLSSAERRLLGRLADTRYQQDVSVQDYENLFVSIVNSNLDLFEYAKIYNTGVITFKFKLHDQNRVTYSVHKPHGRGSSNMIPKEYREEYFEVFRRLGLAQ